MNGRVRPRGRTMTIKAHDSPHSTPRSARLRGASSKQICESFGAPCRREKTNKRRYYERKYMVGLRETTTLAPAAIPRMSRVTQPFERSTSIYAYYL